MPSGQYCLSGNNLYSGVMTEEPSLGLRERKKRGTRRALSDAALTLAFENGLENVTREDIAERAGVSLRTFSNYFTGKYDAIAYRQTERVRHSLDALRRRPADEPLWAAVTAAVLEPLEARGRVFEIGGPEVLRYIDMLHRAAQVQGKRLTNISVPLLSPGLSSGWLALVTDVDLPTARNLVESMSNEVIVRDDALEQMVDWDPTSFDEAVRPAFAEREATSAST